MKKRNLFWDNYKGILIFLVVFGHCIYAYASEFSGSRVGDIYTFIYSFHMPAFVFCSGYFSKSVHARSKESLTKLFLYYVVFNTVMALFAYFYLGTGIKLLTAYYSYWYLLSMITWRAVIGELDKIKGLVLLSLLVSMLLGYWSEFTNLLSLRRTVGFFVFFAAGYLLDRDKVDAFLERRKPWMMVLGYVIGAVIAVAAYWALDEFGVTSGMTMLAPYKGNQDLLRRILIFAVSAAAIAVMFITVPNRKIPLLSQMGRNSLLIYLAHRIVTILFYKGWFPKETYTKWYLVYALIATILICVVFSIEKLNQAVNTVFDKATTALMKPESRRGTRIKAALLAVFIVLLCMRATPLITAVAERLDGTETVEEKQEEAPAVLSDEQKTAIENAVKIAYVGDLLLLKDQVTAAYDEETDSYDFDAMFEYAAPYLSDADLALGVFEGPCAGEKAGYSTSNFGDGLPLYLNFPDEFAQAVKDSGIDFVTTANNHLLDMGVDGAMRTLDVLDAVGLQHNGSYRNQQEKDALTIVEADGVKIAVLSYTNAINYHEQEKVAADMPHLTSFMPRTDNSNYDALVAEIEADFAQAKASDADVILVMAHMGTQFKTKTNSFQEHWNELFAELGADIVLGDHAHIVQPMEYIGDTLVINCPGNFANSYIAYDGDATAIAEIYIDRDTKEVIAAAAIPMYTQEVAPGYVRALPIYDIMTNSDLYNELWSRDHARIQEVQMLITEVMVDEAIELKDVQERYFFIDNVYHPYQ